MMRGNVYDTRFFIEYFHSPNQADTQALKENLRNADEKMISAITIHEIHRLNLKKRDKETAKLRSTLIRNEFKIIDVDYEIAVTGAEISNRHNTPLADSIIAATALSRGCTLISDDGHFRQIKGLVTSWPLKASPHHE